MLEIKTDFNITDNIVAFKFNMPGWPTHLKFILQQVNGVGSEWQNNLIHTNQVTFQIYWMIMDYYLWVAL